MAGEFSFGVDIPDDDCVGNMISDEDITNYMSGQKAKTTVSKERSDYNRYVEFCATIGEKREIWEVTSAQHLDNILCQFYMKAKSCKGLLYEPDTLTSFKNSFQRILTQHGSAHDIKLSPHFKRSNNVLKSRRKELTKLGKGNRPNATRPLEDDEVELLYEKKYFGSDNPENLQRTIWWLSSKKSGHRARHEARQLKWGDVSINNDPATNTEFLTWKNERISKTRDGAVPSGHKRSFHPTAHGNGAQKCLVEYYKLFKLHRPDSMCLTEAPFYLSVRRNFDHNMDPVWYHDRPLGKNTIGEFLTKARCHLPSNESVGKVANHSVRKTSITKLLNENVHPLHVAQLTGHKKPQLVLHRRRINNGRCRTFWTITHPPPQPL